MDGEVSFFFSSASGYSDIFRCYTSA